MDKRTLVLTGHGLDIRVQHGGLKIKDGFPHRQEARETFINRGLNDVGHIVVLGQSGNITFDALKWISDQDIAVTFVDYNGELLTDFIPKRHTSGVVKRRQALATPEVNFKISTWLLQQKFKSHIETLEHVRLLCKDAPWWDTKRASRFDTAIDAAYEKIAEVAQLKDIDMQRATEALVALYYWQCFEGIPLLWVKTNKIPANWHRIGNRKSPKTHSPRKAIDPFNTSLNYLYTVLEVMIKNMAVSKGLDVDFGILHVDKSSRASLVYDLIEPLRPKVDRLLFDLFYERSLEYKDFFETREGVCRVSQDMAKVIIPLLSEFTPDIETVIRTVAGFFKDKTVIAKPEAALVLKSDGTRKPRTSITESITEKRVCPVCDEEFIPKNSNQIYCSRRHKIKAQGSRVKESRIAQGLCQRCGGPMPRERAKEGLSYCDECAEYWRNGNKK